MDGDVDTDGVTSNIKLKLKNFNAALTSLKSGTTGSPLPGGPNEGPTLGQGETEAFRCRVALFRDRCRLTALDLAVAGDMRGFVEGILAAVETGTIDDPVSLSYVTTSIHHLASRGMLDLGQWLSGWGPTIGPI